MPTKTKASTNRTQKLRSLLSLLLLAGVLWSNIALASAGRVTITVKNPDPYLGNHSWFIYEKNSGETIEDIATLKNFSNEPATVKIYAVDATSSDGGSFILTFQDEEQKSIGNWVKISENTLVIGPQENVEVPFSIEIPAGVSPGQYLGGIVVESINDEDENTSEDCASNEVCGTGVSVKTRIGARVYLTVIGDVVEEISVQDFSASKDIFGNTNFYFTIVNNGTIAYQPEAKVKIYDGMGNLFESLSGNLGTSAPGTTISPSLKMKKTPLIGSYTAETTVSFKKQFGTESELHSAASEESLSLTFFLLPLELVLPPLIIMIFALIIYARRKLAYQTYLEHSEEYIIQPGENLISIAQKCHTPWKKIARFNKLKPPYILHPEDKIQVPKNDGNNAK